MLHIKQIIYLLASTDVKECTDMVKAHYQNKEERTVFTSVSHF